MIKQLTKKQALEVVNFVQESLAREDGDVCFEDNGSSRAVFQFDYNSECYVIKLAADMQGRRQNQIEMDLWENAGHQGFLTPIRYAYKDMFIICDFVETLPFEVGEWAYEYDFDYFKDNVISEYSWILPNNYTEDDIGDLYNEIRTTVHLLEDYQGETSDNYQLAFGANEFNNRTTKYSVVAYDYGYSTGVERHEQVGSVERHIHYGDYSQSDLFDIELEWIENDIEYNSEYNEEEE